MFLNKTLNLNHLNTFKIKNVEIPKFIFFNVLDWKKISMNYLIKLKKLSKKICIRSSFYKEDSSKSSLADKFDSFININNDKKI